MAEAAKKLSNRKFAFRGLDLEKLIKVASGE